MANDSLPQIPGKLSWWRAIAMGREDINKMIEQLIAAQAAYDRLQGELNLEIGEWDQGKAAREEELNAQRDRILGRAEARSREADQLLAEAEAKKAEAEKILAEAEAKKAEAEKILAEAEAKSAEVQQAIDEAQKEKETAIRERAKFLEEKGIKPEIPKESIDRDMIVIEALKIIQKQVAEHGERIAASKEAQKGASDIAIINREKATLKAALLAVICAYRDALPEPERAGFIIDGKGVSLFLQDLAVQIVQDSQTGTKLQNVGNHQAIEPKAFETIDSTYKQVAKSMGCRAEPAYPTAAYSPFDERLGIGDSRGVVENVFSNCYNGETVGLQLTGGYANLQRTVSDKSEQSPLETNIQEVVTAVDDWER